MEGSDANSNPYGLDESAPPSGAPQASPPPLNQPPPLGAPTGGPIASPPPLGGPTSPPPLDGDTPLGDPGRLPDPGRMKHDYQSYNEEQQVSVTPCSTCASPMVFNIERQQLSCPSCGNRQEIAHPEGAAVVEQDFRELWNRERGSARFTHEPDEKEIVCQSCGGHTTFVGTLTTTKCPYCATDIARTDVHEAPDRLSVDGVLPFMVTQAVAKEELDGWVNKRWFAPNEYKKYSTHGSFKSVYAAYFTYDAYASTSYSGQRGTTRTRVVGSGDNRRTETYTTWASVSGHVNNTFDDITVLANTGLEKKFVDKLEPWPTQDLQPYHPDYITGHLCRTYDHDVEQCYSEAHHVIESAVVSTINQDIGGDQQKISNMNMQLSQQTYKHVLLPIWLLTVLYDGAAMQVFMNGMTGEIHGERPWSKVKIMATIAAVVIVIILLVVLKNLASN